MIDHAVMVAVMAMVAQGASIAMEEGMIAHPLARLFTKLPEWFHKPLFTCPVCMCSAWGIPAALWMGADPWMLPVYLLASSGLNAILAR